MFYLPQVLCGTDPYPQNFRAKRYRIQEKSFSKAEFANFMRKLPVPVNIPLPVSVNIPLPVPVNIPLPATVNILLPVPR